jgi:hypothetical protein
MKLIIQSKTRLKSHAHTLTNDNIFIFRSWKNIEADNGSAIPGLEDHSN